MRASRLSLFVNGFFVSRPLAAPARGTCLAIPAHLGSDPFAVPSARHARLSAGATRIGQKGNPDILRSHPTDPSSFRGVRAAPADPPLGPLVNQHRPQDDDSHDDLLPELRNVQEHEAVVDHDND